MVDLNREADLREAIERLYFGYRAFTGPPDRILERRGLGRVHHRILYFVGRRRGVSVKGLTFKSGDRIESRGQVLMRCNRAKREKRERYERVKTELQNRAMAKERQGDVDLSSDDPGERAAVVRQHRASGSSLNYQNAQG